MGFSKYIGIFSLILEEIRFSQLQVYIFTFVIYPLNLMAKNLSNVPFNMFKITIFLNYEGWF